MESDVTFWFQTSQSQFSWAWVELISLQCVHALIDEALSAFPISHATDLHWPQNPTSFLPQSFGIYLILTTNFPDLRSSAKYYFPKKPSVITVFKVTESLPTNHSCVSMVCFIWNTYCSKILSSAFTRFSSLSSVRRLKEGITEYGHCFFASCFIFSGKYYPWHIINVCCCC